MHVVRLKTTLLKLNITIKVIFLQGKNDSDWKQFVIQFYKVCLRAACPGQEIHSLTHLM